ncbi:NAD(P)/FAD-dependent oxidoreductase [Niastella caeni]|uniref:NAD(P)/FAD-dependent oxidoreductase n=1 Tax=Niastella caeni TaxID=2569763 RepID=A0A4S8HFX7_9BACT|nr:NAD(P)/FAD-dependent oxidoreductase [Niastella caeni]THU32404.1 NAD(P)/FAD-dependent oxidoreductase [Niastella caeni]
MKKRIGIIGAGPAGLTAAYLLAKNGNEVVVFEADPRYVGGISRTEKYKGFLFDIGGHRFFSKSTEVNAFWQELLGPDLLECKRSSSIYYNRTFFSYPLVLSEVIRKLGVITSLRCFVSYIKAKLFPVKNPVSFEDWVVNNFGRLLFEIFFKSYTEKVWGIPTSKISADWAAQRIKGLSIRTIIRNAVKKDNDKIIKTLIDSFHYPRFGPGMMWEVCAQRSIAMGARVCMNTTVRSLHYHEANSSWSVSFADDTTQNGFHHIISSAPIYDLIPGIYPRVQPTALEAAKSLHYRDFITVVLILKNATTFTENWIYIHEPSVKVGRIQNFKTWSKQMVPDQTMDCYGLEYFCFEGDGMWNMEDDKLIALATKELLSLKLVKKEQVEDGYVVRQAKAYPVYDHAYKEKIHVIREELKKYENLHLVGRNGMHKYNNQDHSIMTAMYAVKNILAGEIKYDPWKVNQDAEYIEEEQQQDGGRLSPASL